MTGRGCPLQYAPAGESPGKGRPPRTTRMQASTLDLATMITGLGGGLALFLYGMRKITEALKTVAGTGLDDVLARLTTNRFTGALSGALITAVIQSS